MCVLILSLSFQMIESGHNRMDAKFVQGRGQALRYNTNPRLRGHMIINENFSIAFMKKCRVELKQLWAVGFSVLEFSKYIMQSLYYYGMKPNFPGGLQLIMSDTDSWLLAVSSPTGEAALRTLSPLMDFSNFPREHPLFSNRKKFQTGFLKSETPGDDILEVVALRSKVYAYKLKREKEANRKCKGVKKSARDKIPFETFKRCIDTVTSEEASQYSIQSKNHVNRLIRIRKTAFSSFDDKRYYTCAIHSFPYGSKFIDRSIAMKQCYLCARKDILM